MVEKPVQRRTGDSLITHYLRPSSKWLVRRNDHASLLIPGIHYLEEQVRLFGRQLLITDFIDEQQVRFPEPDQSALEPVVLPGQDQVLDEVDAGGVVGGESLHASLVSQGQHQVGFPQSAGPHENDVLLPLYEGQRGELVKLAVGDTSLEPLPVKVFQSLHRRHS